MTNHPLIRALWVAAAESNPLTNYALKASEEYERDAYEESARLAGELLEKKLIELRERIDLECLQRVEVIDLIKRCTVMAEQTHYREKLVAAANILGNAVLRDADPAKRPYEELDHFARCVEVLSIGAIRTFQKVMIRGSHPGLGVILPNCTREMCGSSLGHFVLTWMAITPTCSWASLVN
jgi:hypothetical protein